MLKNYNQQGLEVIALNELKAYDEQLTQGDPRATPIEEIIEFKYGLIVKYFHLSKNGAIHGLTVFEDCIIPIYDTVHKRYEGMAVRAGTIVIDSRLLAPNRENRLRFTLAHELGHWIIHADYFKKQKELASKSSHKCDEQTEREADALAAALLMPKGRLKVAYGRIKDRFKPEAAMVRLAETFSVSVQAMEVRMKSTGLLADSFR